MELERKYSKDEILEMYLNKVYYGSGAYGVGAAARIYFGKHVSDLTLAECALIAGLPQRPSDYSPHRNMSAAIHRRNLVLDRMAELGYISAQSRDRAKREAVALVPRRPTGPSQYKAPWFTMYVLAQLKSKLGAQFVERGGLCVYTTLNYEMQQAAEEALRRGVQAAHGKHVTQGALICIDPFTGGIKAMVGGVGQDYLKDQFNRAVQARRQPGSAFKVFVYTAALDTGYPLDYELSNERISFPGYGGSTWTPDNYDGRYGGSYTMREAVARSVNVCAVRMANEVGIEKVIQYARDLGIKSPLSKNLALALGASEVSPLEMCSAYGVFAANGIRAEPIAISRVTSIEGGHEKELRGFSGPAPQVVLNPDTAQKMNELLRGVVTSPEGTGRAAAVIPNAHGKTGTTQNDRSAWFIGYTPELVTAVWVGNDDNSP